MANTIRSNLQELIDETKDFLHIDFEKLTHLLTRYNRNHAAKVRASRRNIERALQKLRVLCDTIRRAANGSLPEPRLAIRRNKLLRRRVRAVCGRLENLVEVAETPESSDERL